SHSRFAAGRTGGVRAPRYRGIPTRRDFENDGLSRRDTQSATPPSQKALDGGIVTMTDATNHVEFEALSDLIDGSLDRESTRAVEEHLSICAQCSSRRDSLLVLV